MSKKLLPIDYTSRDFDSIRQDLENYAKRYYPNTYKDFNKASFGSLMLDTVAYIGDILSFYVDYQANESFLETAVEYNNVIRLARQMGFKLNRSPSSYGVLTFYIQIPANSNAAGPDLNYAPVLQAGAIFGSTGGGSYTLLEDVDFGQSGNQIVVGTVDTTTGNPTNFVIRAQGRAVSGRASYKEFTIGAFERFRRLDLGLTNVAEVIDCFDSEGHEYIQVNHLSQNVIYKGIRNTNTATNGTVRNVMKAIPVARRFVVEPSDTTTYLQFGYGSDSELLSNSVVDPSSLVLNMNGRDYTTDEDFDPTNLINSDKFGIAPANTTVRVGFRVNTTDDVNAGVGTINTVESTRFKFVAQSTLAAATRASIRNSLEVTNEEQFVGDISLPSSDEIRQRVYGYYATQNRAVTIEDYQAICYGMPGKFGSLKRVAIERDFSAMKRNINVYTISEDSSGKLTIPNETLKNNLKTWLLQYKMINDTVDILNAVIVNFGIKYVVALDLNADRFTVLNKANAALRAWLANNQYEIGESILITEFYKVLQKVPGIIDVIDLEIEGKEGGAYANSSFDFNGALTADGRRIEADINSVFEMKFPNIDIRGSVQ
tara:strand:- start:26542 stop:28341 length:1800 start_codon:yes stop_codon:yes gene_type:complete